MVRRANGRSSAPEVLDRFAVACSRALPPSRRRLVTPGVAQTAHPRFVHAPRAVPLALPTAIAIKEPGCTAHRACRRQDSPAKPGR